MHLTSWPGSTAIGGPSAGVTIAKVLQRPKVPRPNFLPGSAGEKASHGCHCRLGSAWFRRRPVSSPGCGRRLCQEGGCRQCLALCLAIPWHPPYCPKRPGACGRYFIDRSFNSVYDKIGNLQRLLWARRFPWSQFWFPTLCFISNCPEAQESILWHRVNRYCSRYNQQCVWPVWIPSMAIISQWVLLVTVLIYKSVLYFQQLSGPIRAFR